MADLWSSIIKVVSSCYDIIGLPKEVENKRRKGSLELRQEDSPKHVTSPDLQEVQAFPKSPHISL